MYCYLCKLDSGYTLKEHSAAKWLKRNERLTVDWPPADRLCLHGKQHSETYMDKLTPEQRHKNMAAIRGKNTKPEMIVRRIVE